MFGEILRDEWARRVACFIVSGQRRSIGQCQINSSIGLDIDLFLSYKIALCIRSTEWARRRILLLLEEFLLGR